MNSNNPVATIHGSEYSPNEPCHEVVDALEMLLAQAKAGEIRAFAYASVYRAEMGFGSGWEGEPYTQEVLAASISHLHHRYYSLSFGG